MAVKTSWGDMNVTPNARLSVGESAIGGLDNPATAHASVVRKGKPGADDQLAHLKDEDYVPSYADRVMNINDPAFGMRYSDAVRPYASALEYINKKYEKKPNYANLSSLQRQTQSLQTNELGKVKAPLTQRINDLSQQQEIQDYVHNKNTYEATMAKCGKNKLPGFVNGNNPNQINTDFARIPSMGIIGMPPRYYNWMNKDFNDTIFTHNANGDLITGVNYEWFPNISSYLKSSANKLNTDFAKIPTSQLNISSGQPVDIKTPPFVPSTNVGIYKPYDISSIYKLPSDYWGNLGKSNDTTPSIFTENPFKGRLGNIYNYTRILNGAPKGDGNIPEDDGNTRNPNARYTGWIPELATQAINLAAFLRHRNSDIMKPDIYHHNPYETAGLSRLANLRINDYPIAKEMRDAERRGAYQIKNAGTSPGQWANQRIALALGTQNNIAKLFSNNQMQNNAYQSDWAKSALAAGENTRNARMKANEYGWNQFIAAHGARELNSSKYMDAIAQTLGQGYSNWWKWNQWRDTMSRYDQAYDLENKKLKAYMKRSV